MSLAPALDDRARVLLRTLIERYVAEGEPVGSRTLSRHSGLELSPATIRNVMADLEELGFIASPHTSAGRIPTARGYRLFVDSLMVTQPLHEVQIHHVHEELTARAEPQQIIVSAAKMLSELSAFAGVVVSPRRAPMFRQIEFLRLAEKRVLLILVTPEGDVQNRILHTERAYSPSQLIEAANYLNAHFANIGFDEIRRKLTDELAKLRDDMASLMSQAVEAGSEAMSQTEDLVVSGERRLFSAGNVVGNMDTLRRLFDLFEQKTHLMHLLDRAQGAQGVQIFIGGESSVSPLDEISMVAAPYEVNGKVVGTLGVIGPTRMAYERVIPIVDITARLLSGAMQQQLTANS